MLGQSKSKAKPPPTLWLSYPSNATDHSSSPKYSPTVITVSRNSTLQPIPQRLTSMAKCSTYSHPLYGLAHHLAALTSVSSTSMSQKCPSNYDAHLAVTHTTTNSSTKNYPSSLPPPSTIDHTLVADSTSHATLYDAILISRDKLFFIAYRFRTTLRPTYALIQVDLDESLDSAHTTGIYYCHFLSEPKCDADLPEQHRRWWPLWHKYRKATYGEIEFLDRIEFPPPRIPDSTNYIAWADSLSLSSPASVLHGPFNFLDLGNAPDRARTPSLRQFVDASLWSSLATQCAARGINPPSLAPASNAPHHATRHLKRKRKHTS